MVEIDLAQVRIPYELIGIPIPEASYILSARSHRSFSSVQGSVRLSLSYVTNSTQLATDNRSTNDDGDWEQLNNNFASRQGPSSLPEGSVYNMTEADYLLNFMIILNIENTIRIQ